VAGFLYLLEGIALLYIPFSFTDATRPHAQDYHESSSFLPHPAVSKKRQYGGMTSRFGVFISAAHVAYHRGLRTVGTFISISSRLVEVVAKVIAVLHHNSNFPSVRHNSCRLDTFSAAVRSRRFSFHAKPPSPLDRIVNVYNPQLVPVAEVDSRKDIMSSMDKEQWHDEPS